MRHKNKVLHSVYKRKKTIENFKNRNSLSIGMMQELLHNLKEQQNDKNLRVVVLAAEGTIFSAGHNLKELVIVCC